MRRELPVEERAKDWPALHVDFRTDPNGGVRHIRASKKPPENYRAAFE